MNVSIIIPAYNAEKTLPETLESLLAQTCPTWEAIVVDDGSTDATLTIAKDFVKRDTRIRAITQPNAGHAAARNVGIANTSYDWLLFLDSDDWIAPAHLERMAAILHADPALDAVHCLYARVASDNTLVFEPYMPPTGDMFPTLARRPAFAIHACVLRRSLLEGVGLFDTSLRASPDWDFFQRIARTGARFGAVREVLAFYRMSPHSASQNAHQSFTHGFRILRQGHAPDPRVKKPHPDHANGEPPEGVRAQVFYLLSWFAGILIGQGKDARPLLGYVTDERFPELSPEAVAQLIFDSANLPSCRAPHAWDQLWPTVHDQAGKFLSALEVAAGAPDLARRASAGLMGLILGHSKAWQPVIEELNRAQAHLTEQLARSQRMTEERAHATGVLQASLAEMEQERSRWQDMAKTYESELSHLRQQPWVRLGRHLSVLQDSRIKDGLGDDSSSEHLQGSY